MPSSTIFSPDHSQAVLYREGPRLLADIGGTNARFALERAPGVIDSIRVLPCADYRHVSDAVEAYLAESHSPVVRHAAIAVATAVHGDEVKMTNNHWAFSIEATRQCLRLETLLVVNDFTALAKSLPHLDENGFKQIGGGRPQAQGVMGLVGAGTGLGVGGLIHGDGHWTALDSEGGHVSFSPSDERELAVLRYCWRTFSHVSAERLVSGPGIELIYKALFDQADSDATLPMFDTAEIVTRALDGSDLTCVETLNCFCGMLGTVASNVALTLGALGGVYIGGGVVPRLGEFFTRSPFRQRFESKGRLSDNLARIPTYVIDAPYPAFLGVAAILSEHLDRGAAIPVLERIRKSHARLSPAEQKVAQLILTQPRAALNDPIAEIARRAEVSQPTVIRFCRTLGCEGLADFKLKLASSLTNGMRANHRQVLSGDSAHDIGLKIVDNTMAAMLDLRDNFSAGNLSRGIKMLSHAARIEFFAFGSCGLVAQDAQQKFVQMGIPTSFSTDPQLQEISASLLMPCDVAVFISSTGDLQHFEYSVDAALQSGAAVIAIAPGNSELPKRAHLTIAIDSVEDNAAHIPMVSRLLMLLLIDMLAVGVSISRERPLADLKRQPQRDGRGGARPTPVHLAEARADTDTRTGRAIATQSTTGFTQARR